MFLNSTQYLLWRYFFKKSSVVLFVSMTKNDKLLPGRLVGKAIVLRFKALLSIHFYPCLPAGSFIYNLAWIAFNTSSTSIFSMHLKCPLWALVITDL